MSDNIVTGMDLDKLEAFRYALKENPVILGLEARGVWEGHSGRSTIHIGPFEIGGERIDRETRHYTIPYGAWREVEDAIGFVGPTDRAEPVEMALGAVAACLCNSIALNAPRNGIKLDDLEIKVRTDIDPSVLFEVKGIAHILHAENHHRGEGQRRYFGRAIGNDQTACPLFAGARHGGIRYANKVESHVVRS